MNPNKKQVVILARVSTSKQAIEGNSLGDQAALGKRYAKNKGYEVKNIFNFVETSTKADRAFFEELIEYCIDPTNHVDILLFFRIDRFTREGYVKYGYLKEKLDKHGIEIQDFQDTIKPKVNLLDHLDLEYAWSVSSPSEAEETRQAIEAKNEVQKILVRMIGSEIGYLREGYSVGRPAPGFINTRIETEHGRRLVLEPHPTESAYYIKMFEMRESGKYSDKEIADTMNAMGCRTRVMSSRDPRTKKAVGRIGGKPISVKQLQSLVIRPIYAGIICQKWTKYIPIKAKFPGLVSVDTFNKANRGKVFISFDKDGNPQIEYDKVMTAQSKVKRRYKNNPNYPFKNVVLCPICKKTLNGSASKGKYKHYPAYHCARNHKLWRLPKDEFEQTVFSLISRLEFTDEWMLLFQAIFLTKLKTRRASTLNESHLVSQNLTSLLAQQDGLVKQIGILSSPIAIKKVEEQIEILEDQIKEARKVRVIKESEELNAKANLKAAIYLMEHLEELLIDPTNVLRQQQLFGLVFKEFPTYEDLANGTPTLQPLFRLKADPSANKNTIGDPTGNRTPVTGMKTRCPNR